MRSTTESPEAELATVRTASVEWEASSLPAPRLRRPGRFGARRRRTFPGALATWAGSRLGFGHNYWAMVAAVVPLVGHTTRHRVRRGVQRIIGTVLGLVVMAGILLLGLQPWQTVLVMALCQFGAEMFIIRQYLLAQIFVTPLALVSTLLVVPSSPAILLRDRIIETVTGAAVGIAVVLAPSAWRHVRGRMTAELAGVPQRPRPPQG